MHILQRTFLFALAVLIAASGVRAQCTFPTKNRHRTITYRFEAKRTADGRVLHVTLEFFASGKNESLYIPSHWAGEQFHSIVHLRAESQDTTLTKDGNEKIVHASANRVAILSYDVRRDWSGPLVNPLQFHPVIMPEYFEFTGSNALVKPEIRDSDKTTVNFDWQKLPADWTVATSFGAGVAGEQRCQSHTGPWREVNQGLYAAGDFRLHPFKIGSEPALLAVRGEWKFTDERAIEQIQKTVSTVRDFWRDENFPYFLITLKPYERDHGSSDGSAFTNAFWMYVSRLDTLDNLLPQLAHEAFHAWDPMKMGAIPNDEYDRTKWFKEGFTEYYAQLLMLRSGATTPEEYVRWLNIDLMRFPKSTSEYVRGRVIALWLDGEIRRQSKGKHSLDDMMFAMTHDGRKPLTEARILGTAAKYVSKDTIATLRSAAEQQGALPAPETAPGLPACFHAQLKTGPEFDLGFDFATAMKTRVVSGVVSDGPAYKAGLRDGQQLKRISVYNGDTDRKALFVVPTAAGNKTIQYLPQGKTASVWRYQRIPGTQCPAP